MMKDESDELKKEFIQTSIEQLREVEIALLAMEKGPFSSNEMRKIKVIIHSIKGSASPLGLGLASTICHNFEDAMEAFDDASPQKEMVKSLIDFNDLLLEFFQKCENNSKGQQKYFQDRLHSITGTENCHDVISRSEDLASPAKCHRVLILEKSTIIFQNIKGLCEKYGMLVSHTHDGYQALGMLLNENFDLFITSLHSDKIDGFQLVNIIGYLGKRNRAIKSLVLTSDTNIGAPSINSTIIIKNNYLLTSVEEELRIWVENDNLNQQPFACKIIHIDDDPFARKIFEVSFRGIEGVNIESFDYSNDYIDKIIRFDPDVILLDVLMGKITGPEVYAEIKQKIKKQVPVIFLTGKDKKSEIDDLMKTGCLGVIKKPFRPKELQQQIFSIMRNKQGPILYD